ncbi:unnamed protein product [Rhizophagus irregularis]|uniref:Uncharacterized protein n=1 Tax=Rhizophagus irregularis TaxID=588596 RepID=A0A915ZDD3_9GLOM|nr:unnamed protein product [Rhizophagus irregularis]
MGCGGLRCLPGRHGESGRGAGAGRRAGQQCRHHARRHDHEAQLPGVERGDRHQFGRLLQHGQGGVPGHARPQMGSHRQYRVDQRAGRAIWPSQLRRRQIGHSRFHQGAGARGRAGGRNGQRDRARLYRHRHGRRRPGGRAGEDRCQDPGRSVGASERNRARRCLPVFGRGRGSRPPPPVPQRGGTLKSVAVALAAIARLTVLLDRTTGQGTAACTQDGAERAVAAACDHIAEQATRDRADNGPAVVIAAVARAAVIAAVLIIAVVAIAAPIIPVPAISVIAIVAVAIRLIVSIALAAIIALGGGRGRGQTGSGHDHRGGCEREFLEHDASPGWCFR